ncbi:MAG: cyclic peptide export ABC transporter [Clostridia bacterium]|nr:cyclic peptide export ABC transporter [Clostridia bacterium]
MRKNIIIYLCMLVVIILTLPFNAFAENEKSNNGAGITKDKLNKIEDWINKNISDGKIPGLSVIIVSGKETVYKKCFGFADLDTQESVTPETLFEMGSTSKSFTALGILKLESEGKIKLSDPVTKYLPWLKTKYNGKEYSITIDHLLHHTSGIPTNAINDIPIGEDDGALERTARTLVGMELSNKPGHTLQYSTINYDVLGLIIQEVSGQSFEFYMKQNILDKLGLKNTYLFRSEAIRHGMATGYKIGFLKPREYNAPMYRGNTPAGYFITNANDLEKWLKIQLGTDNQSIFDKNLIEKSHIPNRWVSPWPDGSLYAGGWIVYQRQGPEIGHIGYNPNFSSFIMYRPDDKVGVGILANINTVYSRKIGQGIINILRDIDEEQFIIPPDNVLATDNISTACVFILTPIMLVILFFIARCLFEVYKKQRRFTGIGIKRIISFSFLLSFLALLALCLYKIPRVLFDEATWDFVFVWGPSTIPIAAIVIFSTVLLLTLYYAIMTVFEKPNENPLFICIVLGAISGLGNAILILIINMGLSLGTGINDSTLFNLLLFFVMSLLVYIVGQRLARAKLIKVTNDFIYNKRAELINTILKIPYERLEKLQDGKILSVLNNDTELMSLFINSLIGASISSVTIVCCFIYLGVLDLKVLFLSVMVIIIAAGLYFFVGRMSSRIWEQARDIQNVFFKFINDLVYGFKELCINNNKQSEFKDDMQSSCNLYRQKRINADTNMANVVIIGELIFTVIIGIVTFVFPKVFDNIQSDTLRNYVFIFLYMTGPVNLILTAVPNMIQFRICWNRIKEISNELEQVRAEPSSVDEPLYNSQPLTLSLKGVSYKYYNENGSAFNVGPIDYDFRSGEVIFITGGNGSGKSTLAKLITGLYSSQSGEIALNGVNVPHNVLSQQYSAIFGDFYLFNKMYGIDYQKKSEMIQQYLKVLQIEDKVEVHDGVFSTTKLSTGQRKRLALLISYLEDRPIYVFDEWAADQDPEFRKYFYDTLLPELKQKGKCVIAITHDDRYFDLADKVIKMEMGQIVKQEAHNNANFENTVLA